MKIVLSGKTGFIGSSLSRYFTEKGYRVEGIGRADLSKGSEHVASIVEGADFVINLAGAPIIKRWTRKHSRRMWNSRIDTTKAIVEAIGKTRLKPKALLSASAVGIYSGQGVQTESENQMENDFLSTLCSQWEAEASKAELYCPTYIMRIGIVLGKDGGALPQMAMPFRFFAGGRIGTGKQIVSWIHINDLVKGVDHILSRMPVEKVFNFTAPHPVSNAEFSKQLARALHKPNLLFVPGFALQLIFGEGAVALLNGQHVLPENLINTGYTFEYQHVDKALADLL